MTDSHLQDSERGSEPFVTVAPDLLRDMCGMHHVLYDPGEQCEICTALVRREAAYRSGGGRWLT